MLVTKDGNFELHTKAPVRHVKLAQSGYTFVSLEGDRLGSFLTCNNVERPVTLQKEDRRTLKGGALYNND